MCAQETSSTDDSEGDHAIEASQSKTKAHDDQEIIDDSSTSDAYAFENEFQLPGNLEKLFKTLLYVAFYAYATITLISPTNYFGSIYGIQSTLSKQTPL